MSRPYETGKSYDSFLFLFFPFAMGFIVSRYLWPGIAQEAAVVFPFCLFLLLLSAASVYGKASCFVLFFAFGCCAATFSGGFSAKDLADPDAFLMLFPYFVWFPAIFSAGRFGLNNIKQLCFGGHDVFRLRRTLKTSLTQATILASAAMISLILQYR